MNQEPRANGADVEVAPVLLTLAHAAAVADTTPQGLRGWIRRGLVPRQCLKKIGRSVRIRRDPFIAWLSAQENQSAA